MLLIFIWEDQRRTWKVSNISYPPAKIHHSDVGISSELDAVPPKPLQDLQFEHLPAIAIDDFLVGHALQTLPKAFIHLFKLRISITIIVLLLHTLSRRMYLCCCYTLSSSNTLLCMSKEGANKNSLRKDRVFGYSMLYRHKGYFIAIKHCRGLLYFLPSAPSCSGLETSPTRLARPWEPCLQMIAGAEFALLVLEGFVIHTHVHFDRCHIFMSE